MTTSITPCAAALIPPFRRLPAGLPWPSETSAECKRHLTLAAQRVTLLSGMKLARGWRVTDKRPSNGEQFVFVLLADDVSASEAACRCSAFGEYVPGHMSQDARHCCSTHCIFYSVLACVTLCGGGCRYAAAAAQGDDIAAEALRRLGV